jgi:ATP-dependent RNA helicase DHX37/DHR1
MYDLLQKHGSSLQDDSYRWFARYLLEGKVLPQLSGLSELLNDEPAIITRRKPMKKIVVLVSALTDAGVDSAMALRKHWAEKDDKFLFKMLKPWVKQDSAEKVKTLWIGAVIANVNMWRGNK